MSRINIIRKAAEAERRTAEAQGVVRRVVQEIARLRRITIPHAWDDAAVELQVSRRRVQALYTKELARVREHEHITLKLRYLAWLEKQYDELAAEAAKFKKEHKTLLGQQWVHGLAPPGCVRSSSGTASASAEADRRRAEKVRQ